MERKAKPLKVKINRKKTQRPSFDGTRKKDNVNPTQSFVESFSSSSRQTI
jgi:hypothetical protein